LSQAWAAEQEAVVVPGNANEAVQTARLLAAETTTVQPGAPFIGDGLYHNATTVEQVEQAGYIPCMAGLNARRLSDDFDHDAASDKMAAPAADRPTAPPAGAGTGGRLQLPLLQRAPRIVLASNTSS